MLCQRRTHRIFFSSLQLVREKQVFLFCQCFTLLVCWTGLAGSTANSEESQRRSPSVLWRFIAGSSLRLLPVIPAALSPVSTTGIREETWKRKNLFNFGQQ